VLELEKTGGVAKATVRIFSCETQTLHHFYCLWSAFSGCDVYKAI